MIEEGPVPTYAKIYNHPSVGVTEIQCQDYNRINQQVLGGPSEHHLPSNYNFKQILVG